MPRITIDSILGGQSQTTHFARKDQFRASTGIDPSGPLTDGLATLPASGLIRPIAYTPLTVSLGNIPLWIKDAPKTTSTFVHDVAGSTYTIDNSLVFQGALSDGGTMSSSSGNGFEYYDNYMYLAKNTDIARFGPLDGDAIFNGTYWTGTLGKAPLTNTSYPLTAANLAIPNHVMHRHSDGNLYIADVQGNQGVIHVISTTKTSVEGDTDNGSTASKLTFGPGLWPTDIESYGSGIVISLYEGVVDSILGKTRSMSSKLAFWDTTAQKFNSMIFVEFPDEMITALQNINGVLYIFSGNHNGRGFRVSRYVGGYSIKEVAYFEQGASPFSGGVEGSSDRLLFASYSHFPDDTAGSPAGSVFSLGLQKASLGSNLFVTGSVSTTSDSQAISLLSNSNHFQFSQPLIGWTANTTRGVDAMSITDYSQSHQAWQSQVYKIGEPFEIKRIRIPLAQALAANMSITATIYIDDGIISQQLMTINSTNFPNTAETGFGRVANFKVDGTGQVIRGQNNFYIDLRWTGSALCVVSLPILIEFDVIPD